MRYRRPSRLRRVAKWAGLVVSLVATLGWALNTGGTLGYQGGTWSCLISTGNICYSWFEGTHDDVREFTHSIEVGFMIFNGDGCIWSGPGYRWEYLMMPKWPRYEEWEAVSKEELPFSPEFRDIVKWRSLSLPLWIPLAR